MTKPKKLIIQILAGTSDRNIAFADLCQLVIHLGFLERIKGDHHIFVKEGVVEIINIQPDSNNQAKVYQVKQVRNLILKYKLMENESL
ncbi:MAG: type II toxin-antitoxin system HicA family toxin [Saprospiraceae bacterium]